ncbi:hypothetical protein [Nostoc sp.]|uniref:hypothetical protein n=1 Tax=Nostoc sp. TaxID=1180 RepID=UPI002FF86127
MRHISIQIPPETLPSAFSAPLRLKIYHRGAEKKAMREFYSPKQKSHIANPKCLTPQQKP